MFFFLFYIIKSKYECKRMYQSFVCVFPQESDGKCILPDDVEADSMQRIVVYDNNTSCLWEKGIFIYSCSVWGHLIFYNIQYIYFLLLLHD